VLATASKAAGRSYLFHDRLIRAAEQHGLSEVDVFSHALTHEIVHMIANFGHDAVGIMREQLELTGAGFFGFTDAQKKAMRTALREAMATSAPVMALRVVLQP